MLRNKKNTTRFCNPFTIKCNSCSEYIFKNKRHNALQEKIKGEDYYGIKVYRFFFKCTGCKKMLSIKTDPKNGQYVVESGCIKINNENKTPSNLNNSDLDINNIREEIKKLFEIENNQKK